MRWAFSISSGLRSSGTNGPYSGAARAVDDGLRRGALLRRHLFQGERPEAVAHLAVFFG